MNFNVELIESISIITVLNEKMDTVIAPDLKSNIILTADGNEHGPLILDLTKVQFADSSGLSALLLAHRIYRDSNRSLVICGLSERVEKLIEISQLHSVFTITKTRAEAIKALEK